MEENAPGELEIPDLETLLADVDRGEPDGLGKLVAAVYPKLKQLARFHHKSERRDHTLNTTAIVHEAYLRMAGKSSNWENKNHFLRASSKVMRHVLVDHARKRNALKRGGGNKTLALDEQRVADDDDRLAVIELDYAIKDMIEIDANLEDVVECILFANLSVSETAKVLNISGRTVQRRWQYARAYLVNAMENDSK